MGDPLKYYDLSYLSNIEESLVTRLGYKKIFVIGKDVHLINQPRPGEVKTIIRSNDPKKIASALRNNDTIGVLFEDNILLKKSIEEAGNNGKPVFLSLSDLMDKDPVQTSRNMNRIRTIVTFARKFGAEIAIATFATRQAYLTSAMQAMALSELLGVSIDESKKALSAIGEYLDN
jgi:RNase P/RNase MRP subunit p30